MARVRTVELPWTQQPQEAAPLDRSNPWADGLVFDYEAPTRSDVTGTTPLTISASGISQSAGAPGIVTAFSGSQANWSLASTAAFNGLAGATESTVDILIYFTNSSPSAKLFSQWDDAGQRWLLEVGGGNLVWVAGDTSGDGSGRSRFDLGSAFPVAGWYRVQAAWYGGGSAEILINGVRKTLGVVSGTCSAINSTTVPIQIGASGGSPLTGQVAFARVWRRGQSLGEMYAQYAAPWALFEPQSIWVPVVSGGGAVPTITFVGAENILATSADYRVTLDYA